jgi:pimeloyl-ACP methyl ester carboxylesterase
MPNITINGVDTYYTDSGGTGTPVVFIHGLSLDLTYWSPEIGALSGSGYRCIAYDWRGMGQSGGATPQYSMNDLADDLNALIGALNLSNPILCGHSQGGIIALQFAVSYPGKASKLVLADTPWQGAFPPIAYDLFEIILDFISLKTLTPLAQNALYSSDFQKSNPQFIDAWQQQFQANSNDGLLNGLYALVYATNLENQLSSITQPVLLIHGSEDALVSKSSMKTYEDDLPDATFDTIEGSGHMTLSEQPAEFSSLMSSFLNP